MLSVCHLAFSRGNKPIFAEVNFQLQIGQALHIQGGNGVGKTSLLRIICGLAKADVGEVLWNGQTIQQNATVFRASLFHLGHSLSLKEELTALENIQSDAAVSARKISEAQAMDALARMGLRGREHLPLRVLSQGQKRRTALARLLVSQAQLWVLDEPFVALDDKAVDCLRCLIAEHVSNGGMALFTSHQQVTLNTFTGAAIDVQTYRLRGFV